MMMMLFVRFNVSDDSLWENQCITVKCLVQSVTGYLLLASFQPDKSFINLPNSTNTCNLSFHKEKVTLLASSSDC